MDQKTLDESKYWEDVIAKFGAEGMDFRSRADFVAADPKVYWEDGKLSKKILAYPNKLLSSVIKPGAKVLDLGSGSGGIAYMMASLGADVLGVDIQQNTIDRLNCEIKSEPHLKLVFGIADLNTADFPENTYDIVVSWNTFHHIKETDRLISTVKKTLKPNGIFILFEHEHHHSLLRNILAGFFWMIIPTRERFAEKLRLIYKRAKGKGGEILSPAEDSADEKYLKKIKKNFELKIEKSFLGFTAPFIARIRGGRARNFLVSAVNLLDRFLIKMKIIRGEQVLMLLKNQK